ncbi:MAG: N-acetyltransferase [Gammaproteobacteria bacterium]|nr:MAG: N-acetyltransferase [Gammaproteobacteria bacterium]
MVEPLLRPVREGDLEACAALEAACFDAAEAASKERIARRIAAWPEGFLVLEHEGHIIGQLNAAACREPDLARESLKDMVEHDPAGETLVIFSLAVDPAWRGRGCARMLLERFVERAREQGRRRILLLCRETLVPFYRRFGFHDRGPSASTHGGSSWREMELELDPP